MFTGWILTRSATLGALGLTKERSDFPFLAAAFRCISRCEGGSEERKNREGLKALGVALRVGIQAVKRNSHGKLHVYHDVVTGCYWPASRVESGTVFATVVQSFIRGLATA